MQTFAGYDLTVKEKVKNTPRKTLQDTLTKEIISLLKEKGTATTVHIYPPYTDQKSLDKKPLGKYTSYSFQKAACEAYYSEYEGSEEAYKTYGPVAEHGILAIMVNNEVRYLHDGKKLLKPEKFEVIEQFFDRGY